jgi:RNA polymerase sigma-70 factor (ECF subfamily)
LEVKELNKIINEAITLLPGRCQQIFRLSRSRGLSYAEIAAQLGISISAVDNQVNIAIKKIKLRVASFYSLFF